MHTPLSYLANGWADCAQILYVNRDPFDKSFTHAWGGVRLHVRTRTPRFPDLANGWANCVQCLGVNSYPLDKSFTHVWAGVHLHVRTCTPLFRISQAVGRIAFKFGAWLWIHDGCVLHMSEAGVHLRVRTCRSPFHTGHTNKQPSVRSATPKALPRR